MSPIFPEGTTLMPNRLIHILGALMLGGLFAVPPDVSAGVLVGGTMSVTVDDTPIGTNFTGNVTVQPGITTLPGIDMTLTQSIYTTGPGTQWLVLDFQATNGQLLAGNQSGYWEITATFPVSTPSGFTGNFTYWSVNGTPTSPIAPFGGGFSTTGTDPVDPSISPVYLDYFTPPLEPNSTSIYVYSYSSPYSYISAGGMNPSAVNGVVLGMQVTASAVPEPSSLCLTGLGASVLGGVVLVRRKARSRAV
jgi:hypothetical protein